MGWQDGSPVTELGTQPAWMKGEPVDAKEKQSWANLPANATNKMIAGTADAVLNVPNELLNLGKVSVGSIADALGHPEYAPDTRPNPDFITTLGKKLGLIQDKQMTPAQQAVDKAVQAGGAMLLNPVNGVKQAVANVVTGAAAGGAGSVIGQATGSPTAEMLTNIAVPAGIAYAPQAVRAAGRGIADVVGGLGTHTGGEPIKQAVKSGYEGGQSQEDLVNNMRGNVPKTDVLDTVQTNLDNMLAQRSKNYTNSMATLGQNSKVLDYNAVNQAAQDAMNISSYTGKNSGMTVTTAKSTLPMQKNISELINEWQKLPPDDFHTAAGMDALKKNIGDLRDSSAYGTPERLVADKVYNAVKNQIVQQEPAYASWMKNYADASDLLGEIKKTLSVNPNASVDTQMRKLQSLMRNNVNTNYGNRLDLVNQMESQGGNQVLPAIAGQALSSVTPRGLGSIVAGATGAGGLATMNPAAIPLLAAQSPRLVGETALKIGQAGRLMQIDRLAKLLQSADTSSVQGSTAALTARQLLQGKK